jgi:hypothetical protein
MAQDPAFLFYYQDFLVGTDDMDNDEVGAYIRCLCHQASKGCISEKHMMKICLRQEVYTTVSRKFQRNEDGNYCNERLMLEISKRKAFAESRRNNRMKKTSDIHMSKTSKTYVPHMENENENEDVIEIEDANEKKTTRKKFVKPDENDVYNLMGELNATGKNFMSEDKLVNFARTFMDHYESNGWVVGKTPMKDWQSTVRNWMRKEWDKIKNQKTNTYGKQSNSTADSVAKANALYAEAVAISRARDNTRPDWSPSEA